jgi:hypothetical protein
MAAVHTMGLLVKPLLIGRPLNPTRDEVHGAPPQAAFVLYYNGSDPIISPPPTRCWLVRTQYFGMCTDRLLDLSGLNKAMKHEGFEP